MASPIIVDNFFAAKEIAASGNATYTFNLERMNAEGFFSLQLLLTGDGTLKAEYLISNDGTNYIEPTGAVDIVSGFTKTSGPSSDGKDIYSFTPELAKYIKIKISETGTTDTITVTAHMAVQ